MPHVFISYVRENETQIQRLAKTLQSAGVTVWLDREAIAPGAYWQESIRRAIEQGDYFLACFSAEYAARHSTYMNEELNVAIEQLRLRPRNRAWFIPVLLSGSVPDWDIGAGKTLRSLQWVSLLGNDWLGGIERIVHTVGGKLAVARPPSCLLISDGTAYAVGLGELAREAGYSLDDLLINVDDVDNHTNNIQGTYSLLILARSEHFARNANEEFYGKLSTLVSPSGAILATPWAGFESQNHPVLRKLLPFDYLGTGFVEDAFVTCAPTEAEESVMLFPEPFEARISFELLAPGTNSTVLLSTLGPVISGGDEPVPIFGYRDFGAKRVFYLNACQHSCAGSMRSPLESCPALAQSVARFFAWIRAKHSGAQ